MFQYIMNWTGMTADQIFQIITMIVAGLFGILTLRQQGRVKALEAESAKVKAEADSQLRKVEAEAQSQLKKVEAEARARLETVESQQITAQAEADQIRMINANMERLISGVFNTDQKWQEVMNTISQRRVETDDKWLRAIEKFESAVDRNSAAVGNLTEMLEIQSDQLGNLDTTVTAAGAAIQVTMKHMEDLARDNRTDVTTALGISVQQQTKTDSILQTILDAVTRVVRENSGIVSKNEAERNQTLLAIKTQLQSIEKQIADQIAPRPALLGAAPAPIEIKSDKPLPKETP